MRYENACKEVVLGVNAIQVPPLKLNRRGDLASQWWCILTQYLLLITVYLIAGAHKV